MTTRNTKRGDLRNIIRKQAQCDVRILLFAKAPVAGKVKTRLAGVIGAEAACRLHTKLLQHTIATLTKATLSNAAPANVRFYCDNPEHAEIKACLLPHPSIILRPQAQGDLGARMLAGVRDAFQSWPKQADAKNYVLLVGSDCPFISEPYLAGAIEQLGRGNDVVFGPANDGGYVLLGLNAVHACLFDGIEWGSERVLEQSIAAASKAQLRYATLAPLADIDRPDDLPLLAQLGWGDDFE